MKKLMLKIDLWFNKNIAPFMTSERKMDRLRKLINDQEKLLKEWQD